MLDRLPDELIALVAGQGSDSEGLVDIEERTGRVDKADAAVERVRQSALSALVLVDRRCYSLARTHLYRRIYASSWPALRQLSAALLDDVAMRRRVCTLIVDLSADDEEWMHIWHEREDEARGRTVSGLLRLLPAVQTMAFADGARWWSEEPELPLTLPPTLRRLSMTQRSLGYLGDLPRTLAELHFIVDRFNIGETFRLGQSLDQVQDVAITLAGNAYVDNVLEANACFVRACRRLRRLRISDASDVEVAAILEDWPGVDLTTLIVEFCDPMTDFYVRPCLPPSLVRFVVRPCRSDRLADVDRYGVEAHWWLGRFARHVTIGDQPSLQSLSITLHDSEIVHPTSVTAMRSACASQGIKLDLHVPVRHACIGAGLGLTDAALRL